MRLSQSLLRFSVLIGVVVAAGCDRDVDSVTAPAKVPSGPNALIVQTGYSDVSLSSAPYGCAVRAVDGGLVCWGYNDYHRTEAPAGKYRQVSAGSQHACALRSDYFVVCWGNHDWGESSPPSITFSQVSAGQKYSCGVRMDNRLLACWGSTVRTALSGGTPSVAFTQISAGTVHACGVAYADKRVLCWGQNDYGETNAPLGTYTQVSAGSGFTCALRTNGTLACWGYNREGETAAPLGTYTQVSAGQYHSCAIRASDRAIVCWGQDNAGSLTMPAGAYTKVTAGNSSTCAVRADSTLVCAGNNTSGQSSPPAKAPAHAPPQATIGATTNVKALDSLTVMLSGARVPGFPAAKTFTYRYDCGDGKGYGAVTTATYARCATRVAGQRTLRGKVIDQDGDTASYALTVTVVLRPQTVSVTSTAPISPVVGTTYTVSASATSGLPVAVSTTSLYYCSRSGNVITFTGIGICTVTANQKGDSTWAPAAQVTQSAKPIWPFTGFFTTVRNQPQWNAMPAGRYVKLYFSLGGNRATSAPIVPSGSASTQVVTCDPNVIPFTVTATAGVGTAGVEYDSASARYVLTWKTDATWKGSCRTVTVTLNDGTQHRLSFKFT